MSVRLAESWLPEYDLSRMECAKASAVMAEFVTLAFEDRLTTPEHLDELLGCFVMACELSCNDIDELEDGLLTDLVAAGMDREKAERLTSVIGSPEYYKDAFGCRFIRENLPSYGLHKNSRGIYINENAFIKRLAKLQRQS
jgi:hypothetical protein